MNIRRIVSQYGIPDDKEDELISVLEGAFEKSIQKERRVIVQITCPFCMAVLGEAAFVNTKGDFSLKVNCPKCTRSLAVQGTRKVFVSKIAEDT